MPWHKKPSPEKVKETLEALYSKAESKLVAKGVAMDGMWAALDTTFKDQAFELRDRERARDKVAAEHPKVLKRLEGEHRHLHEVYDPWSSCGLGEDCGSRFEWLRAHATYVALFEHEAVEGMNLLWARARRGLGVVTWRLRGLGLTFREIAALRRKRLVEKGRAEEGSPDAELDAIDLDVDTLKRAERRFDAELHQDAPLRRLVGSPRHPVPPESDTP